jgi:hypothetical protein
MPLKKRIVIYCLSILSSVFLFGSVGFAAGGHLIDVVMEVDLVDETHAKATMEYNVHVQKGTEAIPFTLTTFWDAKVKEINASSNNTAFEVDYQYSEDSLVITGNIILPGPAAENADVPITLEYIVENSLTHKNDDFKLTVPVAATSWPPLQAVPGVFTGTANLPQDTHVYESFPTSPKVINQDDAVKATVSLQAIPSFISVNGTTGNPSFFSFNKMVDYTVILLILLGAGLMYVNFRKSKSAN